MDVLFQVIWAIGILPGLYFGCETFKWVMEKLDYQVGCLAFAFLYFGILLTYSLLWPIPLAIHSAVNLVRAIDERWKEWSEH